MKRKSIPQSIRFEVFKRDSFRCQYCGRSAPDVVLNIDHINPVADGGDNDITNLLTACFDCNSGKGKKRLSDTSAVSIQRRQLEMTQDRLNQLEMIVEWRRGLVKSKEREFQILCDRWKEILGWGCVTTKHERRLAELQAQFPFTTLLDALEISQKYLIYGRNSDAAWNALSKVGGIAYNLTHRPKR